MHNQDIKGLEAAYLAVFRRELKDRVNELVSKYGLDKVDNVCTELNPENSVPCHWLISELANHYK